MLQSIKNPRYAFSAARLLIVLLLVAAASFTAGAFWPGESVIQADVRKSKPREAFRSGGARSETVLREIASTLKRMDSRLERIERSAADIARQKKAALPRP